MTERRAELLSLLGGFPEKGSPLVRREHLMDAEGYSAEKVFYEVSPGESVSALLLLPEGNGPHPGIVACHQHNDEYFVGKSEAAGFYQSISGGFGVRLCRAGFAVICPDCLGFEDRRPAEYERRANPFLEGSAYERYLFIDALLRGSTLQARYISDLSRAADVLSSLPEVDGSRLGAGGHSLGGQESLWLGWYDERIKAVVCSCGAAEIRDLQRERINHNFAMYIPGFLKAGFDMHSVVSMMAPKPLFMLYGTDDPIFPSWSVLSLAERAEKAYEEMNAASSFQCRGYDHGHGFYPEMQEDAAAFLSLHLK